MNIAESGNYVGHSEWTDDEYILE